MPDWLTDHFPLSSNSLGRPPTAEAGWFSCTFLELFQIVLSSSRPKCEPTSLRAWQSNSRSTFPSLQVDTQLNLFLSLVFLGWKSRVTVPLFLFLSRPFLADFSHAYYLRSFSIPFLPIASRGWANLPSADSELLVRPLNRQSRIDPFFSTAFKRISSFRFSLRLECPDTDSLNRKLSTGDSQPPGLLFSQVTCCHKHFNFLFHNPSAVLVCQTVDSG